jgi:hypothetical protein
MDPQLPNLPFLNEQQMSQAWAYLMSPLPLLTPPESLQHLNSREWSVLDYLLEMEMQSLNEAAYVH